MKVLADMRAVCLGFAILLSVQNLDAAGLPNIIATVKPSIVGIGSYEKSRSPALKLAGTGFVVGDGLDIITNAHVASASASSTTETLGIIIGKGDEVEFRSATIVAMDAEHDLARLKIVGTPLPPMLLGDSGTVLEGQSVAFTGFPLGMILGLRHVTHRGTLSAITPISIPAPNSGRLDPRTIAQLRKSPFMVFQLDGTAYPGNSGSPMYDPETGTVYGVISMVVLKGLKETAITSPSGISYAIPSKFVHDLLRRTQP
jgi:serine protease Do